MEFASFEKFRSSERGSFGKGPIAMLIAEDQVALAESLAHLRKLGFRSIFIVAPAGMTLPTPPEDSPVKHHVIRHPTRQPDTVTTLVSTLIDKTPGQWLHYCFNGEFLFFPFCEHRTVGDVTAFVMEERRYAILTFVIDLYAGDLDAHPNGVSLEAPLMDGSGYYASRRWDEEASEHVERQMDFFGGLRWRFEEHVAWTKRKIDRVGLFQAKPGLTLRADHTLSDEEMNTYQCEWHHSMTASICSFRVAKALRTNPGSRNEVVDFRWHRSEPFKWSSLQLMELGLMEPGQWF